jgi:hypothetical protein
VTQTLLYLVGWTFAVMAGIFLLAIIALCTLWTLAGMMNRRS